MPRSPVLICVTALLLILVLCPTAAADDMSIFDYINEGYDYFEARQYTKAIASFDQAIELEPGFSLSWYNRGVVFYEMGDIRMPWIPMIRRSRLIHTIPMH